MVRHHRALLLLAERIEAVNHPSRGLLLVRPVAVVLGHHKRFWPSTPANVVEARPCFRKQSPDGVTQAMERESDADAAILSACRSACRSDELNPLSVQGVPSDVAAMVTAVFLGAMSKYQPRSGVNRHKYLLAVLRCPIEPPL